VWTIEPGGKKGRVQTRQGSANSPVATIEGDAASFPLWVPAASRGARRGEHQG